jgi:uncharacterized protein YkwD
VALLALPGGAAAQTGCEHTATAAAAQPEGQVRVALRCLINATRASHGLSAVHADGALTTAAERHGADMVARHYFAHVSPEGRSVGDRVRATGYLHGSGDWALGEDIGWGTGPESSPASMFQAWMNSPPHRRVILGRAFRDLGIGIVRGVPVPSALAGATFVLDFGEVR